jgi:hypothetical protein
MWTEFKWYFFKQIRWIILKWILKEIDWVALDGIHSTQDGIMRTAVVNT